MFNVAKTGQHVTYVMQELHISHVTYVFVRPANMFHLGYADLVSGQLFA